MTPEAKAILTRIEADVRAQQDFEFSIRYNARRRKYLIKELKNAARVAGATLTEKEFKKFLHDLDPLLFP